MDKLTMAHDAALTMIKSGCSLHTAIADAWQYADAMQAEADKRKPSGLPESLCEVDWSVAPCWAKYWALHDGVAEWFSHKPAESKYGWGCETLSENVEEAPSFGFAGTHIVERPHGF